MLVIEIMPFVSLLLGVHYRVGVRLLAAGRRGGGEEKEHDEPEDHASASQSGRSALTRCKYPTRNRVSDHRWTCGGEESNLPRVWQQIHLRIAAGKRGGRRHRMPGLGLVSRAWP